MTFSTAHIILFDGSDMNKMSKSKRLLYILLTVVLVFVVGYFIFTGTQLPSELPGSAVETAGAVR